LPEFFPEKRLELKSLKRQTKAEELGDPVPELLSPRTLTEYYVLNGVLEQRNVFISCCHTNLK
jgi:hypothetical protein